jgi:hypothetical protein
MVEPRERAEHGVSQAKPVGSSASFMRDVDSRMSATTTNVSQSNPSVRSARQSASLNVGEKPGGACDSSALTTVRLLNATFPRFREGVVVKKRGCTHFNPSLVGPLICF